MSNIAAFLAARLDEREAIALAAQGTTRGIWTQVDPNREPGRIEDDYGDVVTYDESSPDEAQGRHIAANDPAYVLADIAAKRAILAEYEARSKDVDLMLGPNVLRQREWSGLRLAVRHLAADFVSHPDYDESWQP